MRKFTILVIFSYLLPAFMALGLTLVSCEDPSNGRGNKEGETTFTVRFDRNGGRGTVPGPITVAAGSRITLPDGDGLSKSGYVFDGWNTEADGEGTYYDEGESFTPTGNVTLYAQWDEVVTYTVSFDSNGGSSVAAQTVNEGDTVTRPANPTKSGYTFVSWCRNAALTGGYNFTTPVTEDITLYARWVAVSAGSFIVAFDSNGGSSVDIGIVQSGGTATRPANPIWSGYTFDNWYSDESLTTLYNFSTPVTDNITLYAKWIPVVTVVTYTVTFNTNGATGGTPPTAQTATAGSSITLPNGSGLSKTGSAFGGWNTRADGAGTNHAADSSYMVQNNITLYALWIIVPADSFTVTFDSNGGSSVDMGIVQSGGTATRPTDPIRSGYTFDNWYSNAGLTTVYNFFTPVTGSITLYAKWNPITYTVTFNTNGGSGTAPIAQTANAGSSITLPNGSGLSKTGSAFGGWNTTADGAGTNHAADSSYTVQNDITLYALWIIVPADSFTVTFDSNGGSSVDMGIVQSGGTATRPADPARNGYTFDNWYSNAGLTTVYNFSTPVTGSITLYAKWNPITYTVTFNINGGNGTTPAAQTAAAGSNITLASGSGLIKSGFNFGGWNTNMSGTGTNYPAGSSYTVTGDITLYAQWEDAAATTYTVSFDGNGGSGTVPPAQTVAVGSSITLPNGSGLTRISFVFTGWNTNAAGTGTNYRAGAAYTPNADTTLYAEWEDSTTTYTVSFDSNGGSGTAPGHQIVTFGSSITLPNGNGLTRTYYTFGGWNTNESGTGTNYDAGDSYIVIGNATLYAKWNRITYTVTFSANDGSGTVPNAMPAQAGSSITLPNGSGLTRTNYMFGGWNTNESGTGTNYNAGDSYTVIGDRTLYAQWEGTVTFNLNGGTGTTPSARIVNAGSSITLPSGSGLTRTGYMFGGWNTNESGTGTNYNGGGSYTVTGSITLYAQWEQLIFEMVHVPGGSFEMGTASGGDSDERPVHTVTLTGFYMGKYQVTQAQYEAVMGSLPSSLPSSSYGVGNNYPVYYVSWYDALVFCNKLSIAEGLTPAYRISNSTDPTDWGSVPTSSNATWNAVTIDSGSTGYRLPTEAQWEYAARGGNGSPGNYTYSGSNTVGDVAWYSGNNGSSGTATYGSKQVGTKAPNGLGLYDMSGNVYEWCWDWYDSYSSSAQTDPEGASSGSYRVGRGGGWGGSAEYVRSADRYYDYPTYRYYIIGFRLARP